MSVDEVAGYLEYRVRGDFISSFDFASYQFDAHELTVEIEHKNMDISQLVFEGDVASNLDSEARISG